MKKTSLVLVFLFIVVYAFAQAPDWQWAAQAGGISDDSGHSITIDDSGNSYVIGKFENTATFGSYSLTSYGGMDIFIAKSDANGNWQWATKAGGTAHEQGNGITIDNAGNTYVTGCFRGTSTFGSYSLTCIGGMDIFIAKIDVNGNWQWVSQAGGTNLDYDSGYGITIDNAGNSYITGNFQGTTTFGSFSLTSIGLSDIFVAKIDASGNWQWASQAGGSINDSGYGITMDSAGYCYVTGYFNNTASFGSNAISSIGGTDIFVAKIDANGNWQWATNAGSTYNDYGYGITIDSAGNNYVTGDFRLTASFDSYNLTSIGWTDIFVAKIDDSGNWQWASQAGGFDYDYGYGITIDNSGNSYVTGEFESSATFGSYAIISNGYSDIFLAKMDASGNWLWAAKAGSTYWDESKAIAVDNSGFCYVTGNFQDTVNFSSYSLTSIGGSDIFVAKLIPLTADFTADITSGIDQLTVNFTDLSTFNSTSWEWDFNYDGTIDSYSQNPTWTYNEPGAYTVSLSASDGSISDTETKSDYINVRVNIPDANFKAVINSYLGQPPDYNPSVADLNSITGTFDASNSNISSIDGSQYLTNLTNLNFSNNQIIDISFVSVLTNLLELELSSNQIIDILAISSLTNLTYLWLGSNQIIDISVVSGLTNLTELYLYYNQISDISLISNLTNLTNLNFSNNQIIDISAVSGLTALIELWLSHNQIIDISAISCLTNLYFLHLSSNQISDIYPLVENTGLSSGDYLYSDTNPFSAEEYIYYVLPLQTIMLPAIPIHPETKSEFHKLPILNGGETFLPMMQFMMSGWGKQTTIL